MDEGTHRGALAGRREARRDRGTPGAQRVDELRLVAAAHDQRGERRVVADRKEPGMIVAEQADRARDARGQHRYAAGERLDQHVGPALHHRGQQQHTAAGDQPARRGMRQRPAPLDAHIGGRGPRKRLAAARLVRAADMHQSQRRVGQPRERAHRGHRILLGAKVTDQQQVEGASARRQRAA